MTRRIVATHLLRVKHIRT